MALGNWAENPFIVIWETTRACQLACRHCRASAIRYRNPDELNLEEVSRLIIDQLVTMDYPLFVLTGGDPMERDDLVEIVRRARQAGLRPSITPSATPKVTFEVMRGLKEAGLENWAFSIDGSRAEIHDRFRGIPGTFDLTMEKIGYLHQLGIPLQINTTVSQYNLADLPALADLMRQLAIFRWSVFFLIPTGRARLKDLLSPQEQESVLQWLASLQQDVPFEIKTTEGPQYYRIRAQQREAAALPDSKVRPRMPVWDGNGFLFVSHTGDVYPSGFLPVSVGNVRATPLRQIYRESPVLKALRNPDGFKGKCGYCEFNKICAGSRARAYTVTGDYLESDPFCPYIPDPRRKELTATSGQRVKV